MKRRTLLLCITALASYAAEMRIPATTVYDQQGQRSGGRRITRESLVGALERLHNFFTGVTAPLSFGRNRRVGSAGAVVLMLDAANGSFLPASDWIAPKDKKDER